MFEQLLKSVPALKRYRSAPLAQERNRFLIHLQQKGQAHKRLQDINSRLLAVVEQIDLTGEKNVQKGELVRASETWSEQRTLRTKSPIAVRREKTDFVSIATRWLRYLGRLEERHTRAPFADCVDDFIRYLRDERGLTDKTLLYRQRSLEPFLLWLSVRGGSIATVSPKEITEYFSTDRGHPWKRATIAFHVYTLRSFFRYAASRSWCADGIAATIDRPRMYSHEHIPQGPLWKDVQRLIATLSGDGPTQVRDRAVILLLAIYGFRIGEVCSLKLEDIDWRAERIHLRRPKQRKSQEYPLIAAVGEAILRYVREVRPRSSHREVFLTLKQPYHPPCAAGLGTIITTHIRSLGIRLPHYGPHVLRHACATHLLAAGFSLKEIGDHLGHRSLGATQIYAKVDLPSLRQVAALDISDLTQHADRCQREATPFFPKGSLTALREVARLDLGGLQ